MDLLFAMLLVVGAVAIVAYWISFYRSSDVHVVDDESYEKFERAFPVADAWLVVCLLVAAAGLVMGELFGLAFMLLAGSAGIFLGLMDVTYCAQNGLYGLVRSSGAMRLEVALHVLTLVIATSLIVYAMPRLL